jgi:hypothetical protein
VANIWYLLSVLYDYRTLVPQPVLVRGSLGLTVVLLAPVLYSLGRREATPVRFLLGLVVSALGKYSIASLIILILHKFEVWMIWYTLLCLHSLILFSSLLLYFYCVQLFSWLHFKFTRSLCFWRWSRPPSSSRTSLLVSEVSEERHTYINSAICIIACNTTDLF